MAFLIWTLNALRALVVADALFSFFLAEDRFPRSLTKPLLDPVYAPLRRVLSPFTGSFDLSPLIALLVLYAVQKWIETKRAIPGAD